MVSTNDHVVMNHQNQTRTNGIWAMFATTTQYYYVQASVEKDWYAVVDSPEGTSSLIWRLRMMNATSLITLF
jgi:hypothetical protein